MSGQAGKPPAARKRNRGSARNAGTAFETAIARYLAFALDDDRIERRARAGGKDRGDVANVRRGPGPTALRPNTRVVIECKNESSVKLAGWTREAETERGNDDALVGVVVHKRHGNANPADQWVTMTLADLVALLCGERPPADVAELTAQLAATLAVTGPDAVSVQNGGSGARRAVQGVFRRETVAGPVTR